MYITIIILYMIYCHYIFHTLCGCIFMRPLFVMMSLSSAADAGVNADLCWVFFPHQTCPAPRQVRTSRTPMWSELRRSSNILPSCRLTCCRCCSTRTRVSLWVATAPRTSPVGKTENNKPAPCLSASATRRCFQSPTTWCSTTCTPCPSRWRHRPRQLHAFILTWWVTGVDGIADVYPSGWMVSEPNSLFCGSFDSNAY